MFSKKSSLLAIFLIPLFLLSLNVSCTEQSDYPFMAVGFPISQEGTDIVTALGKPVDKLRSPWIFTLTQLQGSLFPLAYYVYYNPWKEAVFVSPNQITFCPHPTQGRWQSFDIHSAQMGTLEGAKYKTTESGKVIFSISIDRGPHFEFVYQCQNSSIEVISRGESLGW